LFIVLLFHSTCPATVFGIAGRVTRLVMSKTPVLMPRIMLSHATGTDTSVIVVPIGHRHTEHC